jgi:hypothetical protein
VPCSILESRHVGIDDAVRSEHDVTPAKSNCVGVPENTPRDGRRFVERTGGCVRIQIGAQYFEHLVSRPAMTGGKCEELDQIGCAAVVPRRGRHHALAQGDPELTEHSNVELHDFLILPRSRNLFA